MDLLTARLDPLEGLAKVLRFGGGSIPSRAEL